MIYKDFGFMMRNSMRFQEDENFSKEKEKEYKVIIKKLFVKYFLEEGKLVLKGLDG